MAEQKKGQNKNKREKYRDVYLSSYYFLPLLMACKSWQVRSRAERTQLLRQTRDPSQLCPHPAASTFALKQRPLSAEHKKNCFAVFNACQLFFNTQHRKAESATRGCLEKKHFNHLHRLEPDWQLLPNRKHQMNCWNWNGLQGFCQKMKSTKVKIIKNVDFEKALWKCFTSSKLQPEKWDFKTTNKDQMNRLITWKTNKNSLFDKFFDSHSDSKGIVWAVVLIPNLLRSKVVGLRWALVQRAARKRWACMLHQGGRKHILIHQHEARNLSATYRTHQQS